MKHIYLYFLFFTALLQAQVPSNYYDTATGTGYTLKTQLHNIVSNGHVDQGYGALYTAYQTTHNDDYYEDDDSVLDFYSENPSGTDSYFYTHGNRQCGSYDSENDCYNREHLFPQGFFDKNYPMRSDVHHVIPSDGYVNNRRSNYQFGEVSSPTWTSNNGSKVGPNTFGSYNGTVFEPIDEFKGDIARALLYFAVRYENNWNDSGWDPHTATNNPLNGTSGQFYEDWYIDLLLDWHANDPVVQAEIDRNNAAYNFQGNANPFVDHPEFVNMIWNAAPDTEAPTPPTGLVTSNPTDNTIDLTWNASTDNVGVASYDIYVGGVNTYNSTTNSFTATGLSAATNYCFTVYAKDATGNTSTVSNQACEMTTNNGSSGGIDLFFSEYIESSGNNKALEIANISGSAVSLSSYSIKRNGNGGSSWSSPLNLSGSIAAGDVFVVINGDADAQKLIDEADLIHPNNSSTNNGEPINFNGNDPVGLFKNNVLIDIIGVFNNGSSNFAKDVVLRRKNTVTSPNTTFNEVAEWDSYSLTTYSDLGQHSSVLSINDHSLNELKLYPNPAKGNTIYFNTNKHLNIKIYDVLGKLVMSKSINNNNDYIDISNINKGVYLVRISSDNQSTTKKLIRQ